jgi:hypothetical protein
MRDVVEEFERVADYTEGFLTQAGEDFERPSARSHPPRQITCSPDPKAPACEESKT